MSLGSTGRFASTTSSGPPIPETTRCGEPKLHGRSSRPGTHPNKRRVREARRLAGSDAPVWASRKVRSLFACPSAAVRLQQWRPGPGLSQHVVVEEGEDRVVPDGGVTGA